MAVDRSFVEMNRAARERMRALAERLSDEELRRPVGEHWTVAIVFCHLAFWERRALQALDLSERDGAVNWPDLDIFVNDVSLPIWAAVPPRAATGIALETAEALDARLERCAEPLLEALYALSPRLVDRALHRNEHLDEAEGKEPSTDETDGADEEERMRDEG